MAVRKGGLGKGLEALFVDNTTENLAPTTLKISEIEPNKDQPRKDFDEGALGELADSIREHGVLQPLLVRPLVNGRYQIIAGERRWRASRMVGLTQLPVVIREMSDTQAMEVALIENLQREDLNAIEEALGYKALIEQYGYTQEQVAQRVGKSRPTVANALRMLSLPPAVEELVRQGKISSGHGRALLSLGSPQEMVEVADRVLRQGLSVREVEKLGQHHPKTPVKKAEEVERESYYREMELALREELARKVTIEGVKGRKKGVLSIEFYSREELNDIVERLARPRR